MTSINEFSHKTHRLDLYCKGKPIGVATGFVVSYLSKVFLLTNWHVLSGRNPNTGQPIRADGAIPDMFKVSSVVLNSNQIEAGEIKIVHEDGEPKWLQHPTGQSVDVAAIQLTSYSHLAAQSLSLDLAEADIIPEIGMNVFIIGFPFGIASHSNVLPVWKTGHIASEPEVPYNGRPCLLVDVTARPGMSGAPAILAPVGAYRRRSNPNTVYITSDAPVLLLGVYSGRLVGEEAQDLKLSSELGMVWYPQTIREVILGNIRGSYVIIN
jgi:hypothetical protein